MTREVDHYELVIDVRGEHYADRTTIEARSPEDLEPDFKVCGDALFERYVARDDDGIIEGWIEFRLSHVVARKLSTIYRERPSRDDGGIVVGALDREPATYSRDQDEER